MPEESKAGQSAAASSSNEQRKAALVKQIENSFTYHPPKADQPARYEAIRAKSKELALLIAETVPEGRYKALAITHLEISGMCANKAIACDDPA